MSLLQTLSLAWRTDLIFARFDGVLVERPDCLVVRTPANPLFYWGNCLLLPSPPRDAELAHWLSRFDEELGSDTRESGHVAIGFDAYAPFEPLLSWQAAGFDVFAIAQLGLGSTDLRMPPRPLDPAYRFERLNLADLATLQAVVDLHCLSDGGAHEPAHYRQHRQRQMQRYACMQLAGLGHWFGIWHGRQLVADCGLFRDGRLGRFQHVGTHPEWRRRGLCRALVERVTSQGFHQMGLAHIVMCADPTDVAIGIYECAGYQRESLCWGALRPPQRDRRGRAACGSEAETLG